MNPGELKHRITYQALTKVQNAFGEQTESWTDQFSMWASVNPISGKMFFEAEKNNSEVSHKIKHRFRFGIKPDLRIKFGTRIFTINSVINLNEANKELHIMCKELVFGE